MNRRTAFKNLLMGSGTLISLPFWMEACGISNQKTHESSFTPGEQATLTAFADTLIPSGTGIGAVSVGVDHFLQKIIDDCYEKPARENIKKQLQVLEARAKKKYGHSFPDCSQVERQEMLLQFANAANKEEKEFFDSLKAETIRGFSTSQKVMQDYLNYQVAPGHYYGCINVKA